MADADSVVITGGARGIGFATARSFAAAGAKVTIIDRDGEAASCAATRIAGETGARTLAIGADITDRAAVHDARERAVARFGTPAVFVNSAAVVDSKTFLESGPNDWNKIISVCLFGAMNCMHEFIPPMIAAGKGRVVMLASDSAKLGQARLSYYAAAKAGVIALAKSVAQEIGASGVTINVVSPGATDTELRQEREAQILAQVGPEKYRKRTAAVLRLYPLRRIGKPDDIVAAIRFLASEEAGWITGQVLSVNGGFTMA